MTVLVMPDGTQRDVPEAEVGAAISGGAYFPEHAAGPAQAQDNGPSMLEDPLGSLTALTHGAVRGAIPVGGDTAVDAALDIHAQLTDDYSYYNRVQEAMRAHPGLATAGRILGNVGTAIAMPTSVPAALTSRVGATGASILTNAAEGAIMLGVDRATDDLGEHLLERPDISGEDLAASALRAGLEGAVGGAVLGGVATAGLAGLGAAERGARRAASYADEFLRGGRAADAAEAVRRADINSATPDEIANMARNIDLNPTTPLGQAVRRAEAEGVEVFSERVAREAGDEVAPVLRDIPRTADIPLDLIRRVVPDGMLDAQRIGTNVVLSQSATAHQALEAVASSRADTEALALLNIARQRSATAEMAQGNVANEIQRHLTAYTRLSELTEQMTPAAREAVAPYLSRASEVFGTTGSFGNIMDEAGKIQNASMTLRSIRDAVEAGQPLTAQMAHQAEASARFLGEAYASSSNKSLQRAAQRMQTIAESFKKANTDLSSAEGVVKLSRELAQQRANVTGIDKITRAAAIGAATSIGGWPAGMLARELFSGASEVGYRRAVLWRAQNAYARFKGRTAESLLRFAQNPKPRPTHMPTSQQAYEAAVDAIKRATDQPTSYNTPDPMAKTMPPTFVANWVEPRTVPISAPIPMLEASKRAGLEFGPINRVEGVGNLPVPGQDSALVRAEAAERPISTRPSRQTSPPTIPPRSRPRAVDESAATIPPVSRVKPPTAQARMMNEYMADYAKQSLSEKMSEAEAIRYMPRALEILGNRQPTTRNIENALMTAKSESVARVVTMPPIGE